MLRAGIWTEVRSSWKARIGRRLVQKRILHSAALGKCYAQNFVAICSADILALAFNIPHLPGGTRLAGSSGWRVT